MSEILKLPELPPMPNARPLFDQIEKQLSEQYCARIKKKVAVRLRGLGFEILDADIKEIMPDESREGLLVFEFPAKIKVADHQVTGSDSGLDGGGEVTNQELVKAYIDQKVAETMRQLGYETAYSGTPIRERIKAAHPAVDFDIGGSTVEYVDSVGGRVTNQEAYIRQMEAVQKMIDEAIKPYADTGIFLKKGDEEARIDIGPDSNADPTPGNLQLMTKNIGEPIVLNKVNEMVFATSAQGAFSLIAFALINSPSSKLSYSQALLGVVGANAVAFTTSLTSLCLRSKKPRAATFLAKVGALAVTVAVIGAMAIYIPVNIQWLASIAAALPALAVLYA